ncbi:MAG: hypothetical protein PWP46_457 [Fusobacteriaceae bacterium]|jgi:hypothetical protein|nr:hypothetical protein [Fusobacteriaceae bacterium]
MTELSNYSIEGFKVIGVTLQFQQGDTKKSVFMKGINLSDVADIVEAIEAQGEYTFLGMSPVYRKLSALDGSLVIAEGTSTKVKWSNVGLKRIAQIGDEEVEVKSLYLTLPLADDDSKNNALVSALLNKTIAGAKVTEVIQNSAVAIQVTGE